MLKNLAYLAAFTTFVVLVWIALSIYNSITPSTLTKTEAIQVIPLPPTFNTKVIDSLKTRIQISINLSEQIATSSSQIAQDKPTVTITPPQPTSSPSAAIGPNPTNTPSQIINQPPTQTQTEVISNISPTPNL